MNVPTRMSRKAALQSVKREPKDKASAMDVLRAAGCLDPIVQTDHATNIVAAFKVFWASGPTEAEFVGATENVVIFGGILYALAKQR